MTDRAAECFEAEADLACGPETAQDLHGDDWVRSELDHFLDHLDDFDRDQRHFERYGTDRDGPNPIAHSGMGAPPIFELCNMRSLLANWAFVPSRMSIDAPQRLILD